MATMAVNPRTDTVAGIAAWEISRCVHRDVVEEHAQDAAFLWQQRDRAVRAPLYRLNHLARLDARVLAHLEGLLVAGEDGVAAAQRLLADAGAGVVFVVAWLAFARANGPAMRSVFDLAQADPLFLRAFAAALAWLELPRIRMRLGMLAASALPDHRRIALAVASAHRIDPAVSLGRSVVDPDAPLRARALRAIGEANRTDLADAIQRAAFDVDPRCRFWAGWSLALQGNRHGAQIAWEAAAEDASLAARGIEIAMRAGDPAWARQVIRTLVNDGATLRSGIVATGTFGDPATVPWLLACLDDTALARAAAEAVSTITGIDLDRAEFKRDEPAPPADAGSEAVAARHDDDDDLRWPDAAGLRHWWATHAHRFTRGQRHLCGLPIDEGSMVDVLRTGYQRQRRGAAIELALRRPDVGLFAVSARADVQFRRLGA